MASVTSTKTPLSPLIIPNQLTFLEAMDSRIAPVSALDNAKKFLEENPTESKAVVARIFDVPVKLLVKSISHGPEFYQC